MPFIPSFRWKKTPPVESFRLQGKWSSVDSGPSQPLPVRERQLSPKEQLNEASLAAPKRISIEFSGVSTALDGKYQLAYEPGLTLAHYLDSVGGRSLVTKFAVYDLSNMTQGRVKLRYQLTAESRIFVGRSNQSPVGNMQRLCTDKPGKELKEFSLSYRAAPPKEASSKPVDFGDVEQW